MAHLGDLKVDLGAHVYSTELTSVPANARD
jgi:hypothetical protein